MSVIPFPRPHGRASTDADSETKGPGRAISEGQGPSGQLSENHCIARSKRRTWISAPVSNADSFLPSSKARELTVVRETPARSAYARATASKSSMPVMNAVSVNIPDKSTANLPDALVRQFGHPTGMDFKPLLALIDAKLKAKKRSAHDVSNEAGHPDAIRNMRRKLNGELKGGITVETVVDVAKVLEIAPETLARVLMGHPAPVDDEVRSLRDLRDLIDGQISERTAPPARRRSRQ